MNYKSYIVEQDLNSLKSKIVLFYGENLGFINEIKKKLKEKNTNVSFNIANQDEVLKDQEDFFQNFLNNSLFEDRKIFFIDQVSDKILNLIQEIEKRIDTQTLVRIIEKTKRKKNFKTHTATKVFQALRIFVNNEISELIYGLISASKILKKDVIFDNIYLKNRIETPLKLDSIIFIPYTTIKYDFAAKEFHPNLMEQAQGEIDKYYFKI